MSLGNSTKNLGAVQEILVLALMITSMLVLFYVKIDLTYKIGIVVLVFAIVFLTTLANQILKMQAEAKKQRSR
jgi:hypothetical protein